MSRELLKRALDVMNEGKSCFVLRSEIETYLAPPYQSARVAEHKVIDWKAMYELQSAELAAKDARVVELERLLEHAKKANDELVFLSNSKQEQLAALQAREPLSNSEIDKYFLSPITNIGTARAFARAIERSHGITGGE